MSVEKLKEGRPTHYPWEKWLTVLEGRKVKNTTLRPDQYSATQRSMCVMIRQNARILNVNVSVFSLPDGYIKIVARGPR